MAECLYVHHWPQLEYNQAYRAHCLLTLVLLFRQIKFERIATNHEVIQAYMSPALTSDLGFLQDLSYWAFKELADPNAGVIDLMYERLPFCPKADLGVHTPTCDECV